MRRRRTGAYDLNRVKDLARAGSFKLTQQAQETIRRDFGWKAEDVVRFILSLRPGLYVGPHHPGGNYYKTNPVSSNFESELGVMDVYKSNDFESEGVYTHFYINEGVLEINSLKRLEE